MKIIRRKKTIEAKISLINLIDIIFVLLIFFMITTTFKTFTNFSVKLPQSSLHLTKTKENLPEIFYLKNGTFVLKLKENEEIVTLEALKSKIVALQNKSHIKLSADKEVSYGDVVKLMVTLKEINVENVELNIEKE